MKISAGFTLAYQCPQPTQMLLVLDVHPSRRPDLLGDATVRFDPSRRGARIYRQLRQRLHSYHRTAGHDTDVVGVFCP